MSEQLEKKEYARQLLEVRNKDLELFLSEIAVYDDYVRSRLEEMISVEGGA